MQDEEFAEESIMTEGAELAADWVFRLAIAGLFLFSAVLASMLWLSI